mgnify:CR=1 FL=1
MIKRGPGIDMKLQENKADNIRLACSRMNGLIINPGESFSFWHYVGKTSKRNGFAEGRVIINGKLVAPEGMKVAIDGKLRQSSWEDDTGQRRSKVEVVVDEIDIMTRRDDGDRPARKGGGTRYPQTASNPAAVPAPRGQVVAPGVYQPTLDAAQPAQPAGVYDSDIPF